MLEIERKFLVDNIPELDTYSFDNIEQGYISFIPEVRIRKRNDEHFLTKKSEGGQTREELETSITKESFDILMKLVKQRIIKKTRYIIPLDSSFKAELDIYHEDLNGLEIVEVEFPSIIAAQEFQVPSWFGREVTDDKRYKNKYLAMADNIDIQNLLGDNKNSLTLKKSNKKTI